MGEIKFQFVKLNKKDNIEGIIINKKHPSNEGRMNNAALPASLYV